MYQSPFSRLLTDFGSALNLELIEPDEHGYCAIAFDDTLIHFQCADDDSEIVFFSTIGEVNDDYREMILAYLLSANLFWQGTAGATLAVELHTEKIFIHQRFPLTGATSEQFQMWVEKFANIAEHWQKRLLSIESIDPFAAIPPVI